MRLLERSTPWRCWPSARRAADGHGSVVLVAGEAGIGKTVLLRTFVERAPVPGAVGDVRLAAPTPAAGSAARRRGAARRRRWPPRCGRRGPARDLRRRARRAACCPRMPRRRGPALGRRGDAGPRAVPRPPDRRRCRCCWCCPTATRSDVDHPLRPVLGDLVGAPDARRLQLAPLSRSAVAELVDGHDLDPADVHRRTAGNPFFVSQILAQPDSPAARRACATPSSRGPRCAPPVRRHAGAAVVRARRGERRAARGPGRAAGDRRGAGGHRAARPHGRGVAFRHEIARSAVLGAGAPGAERALHAAMIEALEAVGGDASVLAHHAAAAGDVPRILRYAPAARPRRRGPAPPRGRRVLRARAATAPTTTDAARTCWRRCPRSSTSPTGSPTRSRPGPGRWSCAGSWATSWRSAPRTRRSPVFAWYAADRAAGGTPRWRPSRSSRTPTTRGRSAQPLAHHGFLAAQRGDLADARAAGTRAQGIADELGGDRAAGTATIGVAIAHLLEGDVAARRDLLAVSDAGLRAATPTWRPRR